MYRPVGDIFEFEGVKLKVEESCVCDNCFLKNCSDCHKQIVGYCGAALRKDRKYVSFVKIEENMFTKDDLKTGMVVEYNDGTRRLVLNDKGARYLVGKDSFLEFNGITEDLKTPSSTIVKVFEGFRGDVANSFEGVLRRPGKLIWERPKEKVELTLEQIADKFNIPVEQLRIKENK